MRTTKLFFLAFLAAFLVRPVNADDWPVRGSTFFDLWKASCRVEVPGARGSGTFVGEDEDERAVVLTCQHVVDKETACNLQFRSNGEPVNVSGRVFAHIYSASIPADFALVEADRDKLRELGVPYIPLAGAGVFPTENSYILSSGAPKGRFVQAWKGKILGYYNGSTALFEPGPVPGQSGSAIVSEIDGELWVTGILTWLIGTEGADDSRGGAIPISKLYEAAQGTRTALPVFGSPIPPGAKECSAPVELSEIAAEVDGPFVLEFSRDNCQPCVDAEKDVEAIKAAGVPLWSFNVSKTKDAEERARALRVFAYPTFVLFSKDGNEIARFIGSGRAAKIIEAAKNAKNAKNDQPEELPEETPTPPEVEKDAAPLALDLSTTLPEASDDFRDRPSLGYIEDANFLEKSNRLWLNRRGRSTPKNDEGAEPEPQQPKPAPKQKKNDDATTTAGLLDKLERRLLDNVNGILNDKIEKINDLANEKIENVKEQAGDYLLTLSRIIRRAFFACGILGALVAVVALKVISLCWEGLCALVKKIINREAKRIAQAAERLQTLTRTSGDALADIDAGVDEIKK